MKRAFTLVELMVVTAITITLVSLSIPNLLRSRLTAAEGVAITNIKAIYEAAQLYQINKDSYPEILADLGPGSSNPPYLDSRLASGQKGDYEFVYAPKVDEEGFAVNANPQGLLVTFNARYYYVDEMGIIRWKRGGEAGPDDEAIH